MRLGTGSDRGTRTRNALFAGGSKVPKCPKCGTKIDRLDYYGNVTIVYFASLDAQGRMDYDEKDRVEGDGQNDFECPECEAVLFNDEDSAIQFLKTPTPTEKEEIIAEIERIRTFLLPPAGETVTQEDAASAEEALDKPADKLKGIGEGEE